MSILPGTFTKFCLGTPIAYRRTKLGKKLETLGQCMAPGFIVSSDRSWAYTWALLLLCLAIESHVCLSDIEIEGYDTKEGRNRPYRHWRGNLSNTGTMRYANERLSKMRGLSLASHALKSLAAERKMRREGEESRRWLRSILRARTHPPWKRAR